MATSRIISTGFWKDSYIIELDACEKLLFIYFLTNSRTTLAGIYEISLREVEFDTGIDAILIAKALIKFQNANKMFYENNWLILSNFIKHQRLNPSIIRGIEKAVDELPTWLQQKINVKKSEGNQLSIFMSGASLNNSFPQEDEINRGNIQTIDSLSTVTPQYNLIKTNLNKLNLKKPTQSQTQESKEFDPAAQTPAQKKAYAIAMEKERESKQHAEAAKLRPKSTLKNPVSNETITERVWRK